tara:strand:- start:535 stop:684 length:150 start_codon:yes stop_codon:yes gene_type:complete
MKKRTLKQRIKRLQDTVLGENALEAPTEHINMNTSINIRVNGHNLTILS